MTTQLKKKILYSIGALALIGLTACSSATSKSSTSSSSSTSASATTTSTKENTDYFSDSDLDATYDESSASKIDLSGSSATVSGDGVSVDGTVVTISAEGTYIISGSSSGVQIKVSAADTDKVHIVLKGVTMTGNDALIAVEKADKVIVTLADGSNNSITDASHSSDDYSAAIYSKSDITFNGSGSLTVEGNYNNAIKGSDDVKFTGGTYNITSTVKHAVSANDALNIVNATMTLTSVEDALHSDNDEDTSQGNIYIQSGTLTINAGDDGLHASNTLTIDGGTIDVQSSVEGLEAKTLTVNDGTVNVVSSDDGFNATDWATTAGDMDAQEGVSLNVTGGTITVTADGDGFDSNGDVSISGGTIVVNGPEDNGNAAFDYNGDATITGGSILAIGSSGMAQGFNSSSSSQASILSTTSGQSGDKITVTDSSGNTIYSYTATRTYGSILLSTPDLKENETYTISINGNESTTETASLTTQGSSSFGGPGGQ